VPDRHPRKDARVTPLTSPTPRTVALGLALGLSACGGSEAPQLPPPNVTVVTTAPADIPASIELVGQGAASKFIEVRSQLNGVIIERPYREGSDVAKGTLLFRLDPTTYEAAYRSAQAAADNAQARLDNAQSTLKPLTPLVAEGAVDIATEPEVKLWDIAPLEILIREAGGTFTGVDGATGPHAGSALATNGLLHEQVLSRLNAV